MPDTSNKRRFGGIGERYAANLLRSKGYKIIDSNFNTRFAEIDLIAIKDNTIVFVEVKTRRSLKRGLPEEAVDDRKLSRIKKAAQHYLMINSDRKFPKKRRIDVVAILVNDGKVLSAKIIKVV